MLAVRKQPPDGDLAENPTFWIFKLGIHDSGRGSFHECFPEIGSPSKTKNAYSVRKNKVSPASADIFWY
jgi:hypothetical protein